MSDHNAAPESTATPGQRVYARWLQVSNRIGLTALVLGFVVYLAGWLPAAVPPDQLPSLWGHDVATFRALTAHTGPWWAGSRLQQAEGVNLLAVALMASASAICLLGLVRNYLQRREWLYAAIAVAEITVIALAASGLLVAGH